MQEVVNNDPGRDIIGFLNKLGYQHVFDPVEHVWKGKVYWDGPAIFSKYKIVESKTHVLSRKNPRAAIRAEIVVGDNRLHVFSTHLIHTHQQQSNEQDEQVANLLKNLPSKSAILMGDFNATPNSAVIKNISQVLIDSDPASHPTWSIYSSGCLVCNPQSVDTRLDYIFTSKDIKVNSFKVEKSVASDHLPISILIEI